MTKSTEGYILVSRAGVTSIVGTLLLAVGGLFWNNNHWTATVDEKMVNFGIQQAAVGVQIAAMRSEMLPRGEAVAQFQRLDQRIDNLDRARAEQNRLRTEAGIYSGRQEMQSMDRALRNDQARADAVRKDYRPQ